MVQVSTESIYIFYGQNKMSKNNEIQRKSQHKIAFPTKWQKCTYDLLAFNWRFVQEGQVGHVLTMANLKLNPSLIIILFFYFTNFPKYVIIKQLPPINIHFHNSLLIHKQNISYRKTTLLFFPCLWKHFTHTTKQQRYLITKLDI